MREKDHAAKAVRAGRVRVVLHLEPHDGPHTALFPAGFSASVLQKLRLLTRHIAGTPGVEPGQHRPRQSSVDRRVTAVV